MIREESLSKKSLINDSIFKPRATLLLLALLISAWLLWSGLFKPLLFGLGAFSCLLTLYITHRMGYIGSSAFSIRFGTRLLVYWGWLLKEIVRSSIGVARIVLDPRLPISPSVIEINVTVRYPNDQVILGNSITLTPGTTTLDAHEGTFIVHSLSERDAKSLLSGEMDRRVAALRPS